MLMLQIDAYVGYCKDAYYFQPIDLTDVGDVSVNLWIKYTDTGGYDVIAVKDVFKINLASSSP